MLQPRYLWLSLSLSSIAVFAGDQLDEQIITASRINSHPIQTPAAISVLDRSEIEASHAQSLPELLGQLPGLQWTQNGGQGKVSSLFMRGGNSDHVLILVDGVRLGSVSLGRTELSHLSLAQIERIEVVRGPRSGLYGADAMGGVIQIFTRSGKSGGQLQLGLGSYNTSELNASLQAGNQQTEYALGIGFLESEGYNNCEGSLSGGCFTIEPDKDAYRKQHFNARIKHKVNQDLSVGAQWLRVQGESEYDSSFQNQGDFVQQSVSLDALWQINEDWQTQIKLSQSDDETDDSGHDMGHSIFNTQSRQLHWQTLWQPSEEHSFNLGYDYQKDEIDSNTDFTQTSRDNHGIYGQYGYMGEQWQMQAALRFDDNQQFGSHHTQHIGLNYLFSPTLQGFISYGTAFKAPSFNNLYYPNYGNPNLKPEELEGIEIGLRGQQANGQWALSLFHNQVDELISGFYDASSQSFLAQNIKRAKITGIEFESQQRFGQWQWDNSLSWQQADDRDSDTRLPLRANWTLSSTLAYQWQQWRLSGQVKAQGNRYVDASNSKLLSSYGIVNLKAGYQWTKQLRLSLKLNNALDKAYETTDFYPMPGRNWHLGLDYRF